MPELSPIQVRVLYLLALRGELSVNELIVEGGLGRQTAHWAIRRLAERGYATTWLDRGRRARVTGRGREALDGALARGAGR